MSGYRRVGMWLLSVAAVAVSGCALLDPTDPYAGWPSRPLAAEEGRPVPGVRLEGPVDLETAIAVALERNPDVGAAQWDVEVAAAQRRGAFGAALPSVRAVAGYSHYLDDQRLVAANKNNQPGVFSDDLLATDLVVSMPLFTGGRIVSEIRGADLLRQAAEHRLARTREELVFNVSSVYYGILGQQRVLESLEFSRKALAEHLRRVNDLIAVQKAAPVDRLRTEVRLANLQERRIREQNVLAIQRQVLTNLMGVSPTEPPVEVTGALPPAGEAPGELPAALARAYRDRDDYQAARRALEAQARAVDAARAARWPTLAVVGSYGERRAIDAPDKPPGASSSEDVGRVGVEAQLPLFEGGRISARIEAERARLEAARKRLRKLELQVRLEVQTAVLNVAAAAERIQATTKAIEQAKESLRIEREKYELGKGSITDVLDAQSALLDAETSHARALAEFHTSMAQYRLAVGEKQ